MIRFQPGIFVIYARDISTIAARLTAMRVDGNGNIPLASCREGFPLEVAKPLHQILDSKEELPIRYTLLTKIRHLAERVETDGAMMVIQAETLFADLHNDLIRELMEPVFLMIPAELRHFYLETVPLFGEEVADRFPRANNDICAAGRCIALDEWTAAVFHLMRVHEIALRDVGIRLNLKVKDTIDYQDWKVIIDGIEAAAKNLPSGKQQGEEAAKQKEFYNELATYAFHIKEAWRVPVMHARADFAPRRAMIVWENTKAMMQLLASQSLVVQ